MVAVPLYLENKCLQMDVKWVACPVKSVHVSKIARGFGKYVNICLKYQYFNDAIELDGIMK